MYYLELYYTLINTISPGKNKLLLVAAFHRLYGRGSSQYARHGASHFLGESTWRTRRDAGFVRSSVSTLPRSVEFSV